MDELKAAYRTWLLAEQAHCKAYTSWLALCLAELEGQPPGIERSLAASANRQDAQNKARRAAMDYEAEQYDYVCNHADA